MNQKFGLLAFLHWNHDWNNYHFKDDILLRALQQLEDLGVGFLRIDILWSDLHRGPWTYDFTRYDRLIALIKKHRLNILAVLQYNKDSRKDGRDIWNTPPSSFDEFAAYVQATVSRYKSDIHHWEIWNEPNLPVYWSGPQDHLESYSKLLSLSFRAAKKADPGCLILNGGLTAPVVEDVDHLYRQGGKNFTDIINIHTFLNPLDPHSPNQFDRLLNGVQETMARHGDPDKKIWITEMGCPGVPSGKDHLTWFAGPSIDEKTQALWLEKQYQMIDRHPRVEKLFWAFYRDTDGEFNDASDYLGLVRFDLSPKPAFHRLRDLIRANKKQIPSRPNGLR